ncbi:hypothetical protein WS67_13130 [Burkholderia singularis]|uniref:Uncharacterized protein n=1 Tax=Burkholderia singularis TaxID=1503053 RepID=A0A103E1F8_9BURK|nr:hypothetical protein WS67_13130 [Burkholderia singularis]
MSRIFILDAMSFSFVSLMASMTNLRWLIHMGRPALDLHGCPACRRRAARVPEDGGSVRRAAASNALERGHR